jgi:hypothetical protein
MDANTFVHTCFGFLNKAKHVTSKFEKIVIVEELFTFIYDNIYFITSEQYFNKEQRDKLLSTIYHKCIEFLKDIRSFDCGSDINKIDTCRNLENLLIDISNAIESYFDYRY